MTFDDFAEWLKVLVIAAGVRALYETARGCHDKLTATKNSANFEIDIFGELKRKSVEKYALAQEKKWRNWVKSLSK